MRTAAIYNFLIEANIIAGIAILLMIPVRKYFRKYLGNRALCFAWLLVAVRLLCPLALPNPFINEIKTPYNLDPVAIRPIAGQVKVRLTDAVSDLYFSTMNAEWTVDENGAEKWVSHASPLNRGLRALNEGLDDGAAAHGFMAAYLMGAAGVTAWFVFSNVRFRRKLKKGRIEALSGEMLEQYKALCAEKGVRALPVYLTDPLSSACLVGVIRPYIALPLGADREQARQMLIHEICHYKAADHVWTLIQLLCCAVHWFNPLVWLAARMSRMDRELKCDDSATRGMDEEGKKAYAGTLIRAVARRAEPGIPVLAAGMSMTGRRLKTRVRSILEGGRSLKALALAFGVCTSLLLICAFATAEMPYDRGAIPQYGESDSFAAALEEALSQEGAVKDELSAIRLAQEAWSLEALGVDTAGATWTAFVDETGDYHRPAYRVTARLQDGTELLCAVYVDGGGLPTFYNPGVYELRWEAREEKTDPDEGYRQELKAFAYAFAETVEPGITDHFTEWIDHGNEVNGDTRIATFEAWYDDGMEDGAKSFAVQISPVVRIIEYGDGNG